MTRTARILVAVAALLMSASFVLPLWRISLKAPQYPEGLGMLIRIATVDGAKEGDLQSINGLNHYIGMKRIEPDAIPELRLMPLLLVVSGLGIAAWGRRGVFIGWAAALATLLIAGLGDYWKWGYDYGHDLDPNAIIKIQGMSYQPPLIGSKQLLNFTATSWPASGGWLLVVAATLVACALAFTLLPKGRRVLSFALFGLTACGATGPQAMILNRDACEFCRMTIADSRFGGEAVLRTGRLYEFDSIECLAGWARTAQPGTAKGLFVIDLQHPGTFVPVEQAGFLKGAVLNSPMGKSLVAFTSPKAAEEERAMLGGRVLVWADVLADSVIAAAGTR